MSENMELKTVSELIDGGRGAFYNSEIMDGKFIVKCLYCEEEFNFLDGYWNEGEWYAYVQCSFCRGDHETKGFI